MQKQGQLFLLVGPSGAGKNTLIEAVLQLVSNCRQMPTATTRPRRVNESEGEHHFFFTDEDFVQGIQSGAFVEWQQVHGNKYGVLRSTLEEGFRSGRNYIADIEVLGATVIKDSYPNHVILIFVTPSPLDKPNIFVLEERIRRRSNISEDEIKVRLDRVLFEFTYISKCDYVIINDDLNSAIHQLRDIIIHKP